MDCSIATASNVSRPAACSTRILARRRTSPGTASAACGIAHLEVADALHRDRRIRRRAWRAAARRPAPPRAPARPCPSAFGSARFIQPSCGGLQARRARFHVVLRIEVRARGIGRADRVHNRQVPLVEQRLERRERGMQAEEAVQVDGGVFAASVAAARAAARRWSGRSS